MLTKNSTRAFGKLHIEASRSFSYHRYEATELGEEFSDETTESLVEVLASCRNGASKDDVVAVLEALSSSFAELSPEGRAALAGKALGQTCLISTLSGAQQRRTRQRPTALDSLIELFPDLSSEFLKHALRRELGDMEAAAVWLAGLENAEEAECRWQAAQQAQERESAKERKAEARARKALLNRFAFQPVPTSTSKPVPEPPDAKARAPASGPSSNRQVRYRDGLPVASKGEKFLIQDTKAEWNGGSSGKVYTKGKRGKGVV